MRLWDHRSAWVQKKTNPLPARSPAAALEHTLIIDKWWSEVALYIAHNGCNDDESVRLCGFARNFIERRRNSHHYIYVLKQYTRVNRPNTPSDVRLANSSCKQMRRCCSLTFVYVIVVCDVVDNNNKRISMFSDTNQWWCQFKDDLPKWAAIVFKLMSSHCDAVKAKLSERWQSLSRIDVYYSSTGSIIRRTDRQYRWRGTFGGSGHEVTDRSLHNDWRIGLPGRVTATSAGRCGDAPFSRSKRHWRSAADSTFNEGTNCIYWERIL